MNEQLRQLKKPLRQFMQDHYSDDRLLALLDHARAGKLKFMSCCCFVGCATSDHTLRDYFLTTEATHLTKARELSPLAGAAESAYRMLDPLNDRRPSSAMDALGDPIRRARIIPMILAEIKRRGRLRRTVTTPVEIPEHVSLNEIEELELKLAPESTAGFLD